MPYSCTFASIKKRFMDRHLILLPMFCLGLFGTGKSQDSTGTDPSGTLSLGGRTTLSLFNEGAWGNPGTGTGGHFRIRLSERVNTEWYADFITSTIDGKASRLDHHIGWSVLYYYGSHHENERQNTLKPFLEAGHCFDLSSIRANATGKSVKRWSSAVQVGTGVHFLATKRFDITLKSQYMTHLGTNIHTRVTEEEVELKKHEGMDLEGHILTTLSVNYRIGHLW